MGHPNSTPTQKITWKSVTWAISRQTVPIRRVLMTYLETEAMNRPYREAEAVLLVEPENQAF